MIVKFSLSLIFGISFLLNNHQVESFPRFFRGRLVRVRNEDNSHLKNNTITEQYYTQRLDHFDEALTKTWNQVNEMVNVYQSQSH